MTVNLKTEPKTYEQLIAHISELYAKYMPTLLHGVVQKCKSPIEKIAAISLWILNEEYGSKNLHITPQKKIGKYTVDFEVLYHPFQMIRKGEDPLVKIVIECDGHEFHEKTREQVSRDKERDRELQKMGYTVLRYSGSDLYNNWRTLRDDVYDLIDPDEKKEIEEWIAQQKAEGWT